MKFEISKDEISEFGEMLFNGVLAGLSFVFMSGIAFFALRGCGK